MALPFNSKRAKALKKIAYSNKIIKLGNNVDLYIILLIVTAYFIIFSYLPMLGIQIAFKNFVPTRGIWGSPWVGLKHFKQFFNSYQFSRVIRNTLGLSLYDLLVSFPIPIILGLSLNEVRSKIFKATVQNATYLPHFLSNVVIVGMIQTLICSKTGVVNIIIQALGAKPINFLIEPEYFKSLYVFSKVWQHMGWSSIIYLSALTSIDPCLHESAVIDGANIWRRIWHINLPALKPTITVLLLLNLGRIMTIGFEKVYLMQNNLNLRASDIIVTYVYRIGILEGEYSFAAAVGLFNSVINLILLVFANFCAKKFSEYSLW